MSTKSQLYHGTLLRNISSIEAVGLIPSVGDFTRNMYGKNAPGIVPAVFLADETGLERVVHAMVAAIIEEVTDEDFEAYDIGHDYQMNDELFFKYGALLVVEPIISFSRTGSPKPGVEEPSQAESGDWYSLENVRPIKTITGDDLGDFLCDRGLLPSLVNDFVDPESVRSATDDPPALKT